MNSIEREQLFLSSHLKYFPQDKAIEVKEQLSELRGDQYLVVSALEFRDPTMMLIISIVVGYFGIDRFLLGQIWLGVAKLLTGGGCGIWWFVDLFIIQNGAKKYNYGKFVSAIINETAKSSESVIRND